MKIVMIYRQVVKCNVLKFKILASIWAINYLVGIVISVKILGLKFLSFIAVSVTVCVTCRETNDEVADASWLRKTTRGFYCSCFPLRVNAVVRHITYYDAE